MADMTRRSVAGFWPHIIHLPRTDESSIFILINPDSESVSQAEPTPLRVNAS